LKKKRSVRDNTIGCKPDERFSLFANAAIVDELQGALQVGSQKRKAATVAVPPTTITEQEDGGT
jgi:hypothetical protein